ncbi:MAG TPA: hypothetical protein VJQ49_01855 [Casimicrobiaceae bacterium]|nr:hypothetical protein [Casimicrobiaceae bacterium]
MRYLMLVLATCGVGLADAEAALLEKWGPTWSELSGSRYYARTILNRTSAIILSVDGRSYTDRVVKIEPGKHQVSVQSPRRKGFLGTVQPMEIDAAPCKRYYINAQFASGVGTEWKPVVSYVEPVAGCKVPAAKK